MAGVLMLLGTVRYPLGFTVAMLRFSASQPTDLVSAPPGYYYYY
jgi:hypothetical protein